MVHYDALEPNLECYWAVYRSRAVRYTRVHGVPIEKKKPRCMHEDRTGDHTMTSCTFVHQTTCADMKEVKFYLFIYEEAISKSCEESTSNFVMIKKFNFIYNQSDILFNIVFWHSIWHLVCILAFQSSCMDHLQLFISRSTWTGLHGKCLESRIIRSDC